MIGYESLISVGPNCSILVLSFAFALTSIYVALSTFYWGNEWATPENYDHVPILKWVKDQHGWKQVVIYGKYRDYFDNKAFDWTWHHRCKGYCFVEEVPPPEVFIFCSPGMKTAVNEIISNTSKETYF